MKRLLQTLPLIFFNDEQFINKVASENVSLSKSIVDFFSDIIDSINHLISKVTNRNVADTLKGNKKMYEKHVDTGWKVLRMQVKLISRGLSIVHRIKW